MLCLVLEWPLLCAVPVSSVPSRKPPLLLEALPIFCLSQLFPDEEACFFAAVFGQMIPWGRSPRIIPAMPDYVWAAVIRVRLGGRKWRMLSVSLKTHVLGLDFCF